VWSKFPNVSIVRGDLLHPIVSGNKLFKLEPLLEKALSKNVETLISVGGRYSNHLHALAWAGRKVGLQTVGVVSGYPAQPLTPTLKDCIEWGMKIHFVGRKAYQSRHQDDFWETWLRKYPASLRIDEGGWSPEAIRGSASWWQGIQHDTQIVLCAIGSGSTMAGLIRSAPSGIKVIGVPVFKDPDGYRSLTAKLEAANIPIDESNIWNGHAGQGFGKLDQNSKDFKTDFEQETKVLLDPVYTTKVFYALEQELLRSEMLRDMNIAVLHTGGLQGNRS
jgi:1-aminocyclopropane-1-carboxylate deaminase